jgi:hypothetical protein
MAFSRAFDDLEFDEDRWPEGHFEDTEGPLDWAKSKVMKTKWSKEKWNSWAASMEKKIDKGPSPAEADKLKKELAEMTGKVRRSDALNSEQKEDIQAKISSMEIKLLKIPKGKFRHSEGCGRAKVGGKYDEDDDVFDEPEGGMMGSTGEFQYEHCTVRYGRPKEFWTPQDEEMIIFSEGVLNMDVGNFSYSMGFGSCVAVGGGERVTLFRSRENGEAYIHAYSINVPEAISERRLDKLQRQLEMLKDLTKEGYYERWQSFLAFKQIPLLPGQEIDLSGTLRPTFAGAIIIASSARRGTEDIALTIGEQEKFVDAEPWIIERRNKDFSTFVIKNTSRNKYKLAIIVN